MASKTDPWNLILDHRYAEAATQYVSVLRAKPDDVAALGGHATSMLCLGQLAPALDEFRRANVLESNDLRKIGGRSQPYLTKIGAILWLLGRRDEAVATFMAGARGIMDGSIEFGDNAGGVSHGLLLWFAAVTTHDDDTS